MQELSEEPISEFVFVGKQRKDLRLFRNEKVINTAFSWIRRVPRIPFCPIFSSTLSCTVSVQNILRSWKWKSTPTATPRFRDWTRVRKLLPWTSPINKSRPLENMTEATPAESTDNNSVTLTTYKDTSVHIQEMIGKVQKLSSDLLWYSFNSADCLWVPSRCFGLLNRLRPNVQTSGCRQQA